MRLTITPGFPLQGSLTLPGDKSISHRSILMAAIMSGTSTIRNLLIAGVTTPLLDALGTMGIEWSFDENNTLILCGKGLKGLKAPAEPINCGNSATSMRLLAGVLAAAGIPATLDGSPGLRRRPMGRIIDPLREMGVPVNSSPAKTAPLVFNQRDRSRKLSSISYHLPVASAQVKSCLLLAALDADSPTLICEPELSRDHTERMLRMMGVWIEESEGPNQEYCIKLFPPTFEALQPLSITIPGDISSAAFFMVAATITPGSMVSLKNVGINPTRTGIIDALMAMGADISIINHRSWAGEPVADLEIRSSRLKGIDISRKMVVRMIDEFPAFAVAAAFAEGITTVTGAEELRFKESDRISALSEELAKLGVHMIEKPDGFIIDGGGAVRGGSVSSHQDHRLAMSLSVASLASVEPITVEGAEIVSESYPDFSTALQNLGSDILVET